MLLTLKGNRASIRACITFTAYGTGKVTGTAWRIRTPDQLFDLVYGVTKSWGLAMRATEHAKTVRTGERKVMTL